MDPGHLIVALWLLLPVVFVCLVWWSWAREKEIKNWRRTATLISAISSSASSVVMAVLLIWANSASLAPAVAHRGLFASLIFFGLGLSVASSIVVVFGRGMVRWVIIPAAILQALAWLLLAQIATMPLFPG